MDDKDSLQKKLDRNFELNQENNELLHKLWRSVVWGRVAKVIYWVIIIGVAVGAFYFLQPYVSSIRDVSQEFRNAFTDPEVIEVSTSSERLQHVE